MSSGLSQYGPRGLTDAVIVKISRERFAKIWGVSPNHTYKWGSDPKHCETVIDCPYERLEENIEELVLHEGKNLALILVNRLARKVGGRVVIDDSEDVTEDVKSMFAKANFSVMEYLKHAYDFQLEVQNLYEYLESAKHELDRVFKAYRYHKEDMPVLLRRAPASNAEPSFTTRSQPSFWRRFFRLSEGQQ